MPSLDHHETTKLQASLHQVSTIMCMALLDPKDTKEPKIRESIRFELIDFLFCPSLSDPQQPSIQLFVCSVLSVSLRE